MKTRSLTVGARIRAPTVREGLPSIARYYKVGDLEISRLSVARQLEGVSLLTAAFGGNPPRVAIRNLFGVTPLGGPPEQARQPRFNVGKEDEYLERKMNMIFDFLTNNPVFALLKKDHDTVKDLFDRFEKADSLPAKKKIVEQALTELKVHATIEEELFYPAVRKAVGKDLMNEADEEHHVAKVLIAELDQMDGRENHYDAKFTVLAENVRHHIREEESEVFPKAKDANIDFEVLSKAILQRKKTLLAKGVPPAPEEAMVAASHGKGDSPAQAAQKPKPRAAKKLSGKGSQ